MYSTSAASSAARNRAVTRAAQGSEELKQRVTAVIDIVDHAAGNVAALIANDLESSAAESELQLLPKYESSCTSLPLAIFSSFCKR